jgi:hypothetical protein
MMRGRLPTTVAVSVALWAVGCGADKPGGVVGTSGATTNDAGVTTSTSGSVGSSSPVTGTHEPLGNGHGCCEPHDPLGCDEAAVQACVCDQSPACCTFRWDEPCVQLALACDATCMADPDPTSAETGDASSSGEPPVGTTCCEVSASGGGCDDAAVTACTCRIDAYCCDNLWDEYCVAIASESCSVDCGNDCCTPHDTVACNDAGVFGCVVEQNDACFASWENACVDQAISQCGLTCS